jgi:hypothetical protein
MHSTHAHSNHRLALTLLVVKTYDQSSPTGLTKIERNWRSIYYHGYSNIFWEVGCNIRFLLLHHYNYYNTLRLAFVDIHVAPSAAISAKAMPNNGCMQHKDSVPCMLGSREVVRNVKRLVMQLQQPCTLSFECSSVVSKWYPHRTNALNRTLYFMVVLSIGK